MTRSKDQTGGIRKLLLILIFLTVLLSSASASAQAASVGPLRLTTITKTVTQYEWWLLTWAESERVCRLLIEQNDQPSSNDIYELCGADIYADWISHPFCPAAQNDGDTTECPGLYLYFIGTEKVEQEILVEIPPPTVWLEIDGCEISLSSHVCSELPMLKLVGYEPMIGERIEQIQYTVGNRVQICGAPVCSLPIWQTSEQGELMSFWAESSYGDSSPSYSALVRVLPVDNSVGWQVQIVSTQWVDGETPAFAIEWGAIPSISPTPDWLSFPSSQADLETDIPYSFLAGQLLRHGFTHAARCPSEGVAPTGYATQCGLEESLEEVIAWQNRFDGYLLQLAFKYRVSPELIKRVIAIESQFWPGEYEYSPQEYGFGHLTDSGADTLLRWNSVVSSEFCMEVFINDTCELGYSNIGEGEQEILRGYILDASNPRCGTCPNGIDPEKLNFSIRIVVESLLANAAQINQILINFTNQYPGNLSTYEDLWRFTLVNYNAGPGCLSTAIKTVLDKGGLLDWEQVSNELRGDCRNAIDYVQEISMSN